MSESKFEALVGALVLAVCAAFLFYLTRDRDWFGEEGGYEIYALFDSAQGISVGTPVRMAGVPVGSVSGVTLDPQTFFAKVQMTVEEDLEISKDSQAVVASEGLLGGQFIELSQGGSETVLLEGELISDTRGYRDLMTVLTQSLLASQE